MNATKTIVGCGRSSNFGGMNTGTSAGRTITVIEESHPNRPALDTAVSRAVLEQVAAGRMGETFRLYIPGRVVAFGRQDVVAQGYRGAVDACRREGFEAVERLAGGRAAVFHEGTLAFSWAIPTADPLREITAAVSRNRQDRHWSAAGAWVSTPGLARFPESTVPAVTA